MDYSKAKIYKILNDIDDDIYVGATCQSLSQRIAEHRKNIFGKQTKEWKFYMKMRDLGVEHFYIELVKEAPCESREQLRAIEGEYIRTLGTLNTKIAGRTKKQYTQDTKEKKKEYDRKRREEIGEEINQRRRNTYWQDVEKSRENKRQQYQENPEKVLQYQKRRVNCKICGKELSQGFVYEHLKKQHPNNL